MKFLIFAFLLFSITSCEQNQGVDQSQSISSAVNRLFKPSPKTVLNDYLMAGLENRDYAVAYNLLSTTDKAYLSFEEYKNLYTNDTPMSDTIMSKVTFNIQSVKENGSNAVASVELTIPDTKVIFGDLMGAALAEAFSGSESNEKALEQAFKDKYSDGKLPTTTEIKEYNLVEEEAGWRVYENFKGIDERRKRDEKIKAMLNDAKELRANKEYVKAIDIYSAVLDKDANNSSAVTALEETENELKNEKIKKDYIKRIKIYDFVATRIDTYSDKNVPAVTFAIKNEGDRTLNKVEVTVYFKDVDGNIIFEEDFYPVLVSEYSFRDSKPLKPNYIQRQEKGKFYTINELGKEWKTGSAEAVITNIEFAPD